MTQRPAATPALCGRFHRASELIGRRWTGAIIFVLLKSRCRFATLRDAIPDITDRMLSDRLQELEQEGISSARSSPRRRPRRVRADQERPRPRDRDGRDRRLGGQVDRRARPGAGARPRVSASRQRLTYYQRYCRHLSMRLGPHPQTLSRRDFARRSGRRREPAYSIRTRPRRVATLAASVRLVTPSFSNRWPRCVFTVRSLMPSVAGDLLVRSGRRPSAAASPAPAA